MALKDSHEDLAAALAVSRELGGDYDKALAQGVVERMSQEIDARVDQRVAEVVANLRFRGKQRGGTLLALSSLVLGIPISAVAGNFGHVAGLAVAWGGIVAVNAANAVRRSLPAARKVR